MDRTNMLEQAHYKLAKKSLVSLLKKKGVQILGEDMVSPLETEEAMRNNHRENHETQRAESVVNESQKETLIYNNVALYADAEESDVQQTYSSKARYAKQAQTLPQMGDEDLVVVSLATGSLALFVSLGILGQIEKR